ncbi:MAG: hypothetical protein U9N56_11480 [Actinomycetota bacterium]|nr:hypothetical protein [Actinomycetota bacterium]
MSEILRLARAHENKALLDIDGHIGTESLLALLPARETRQARIHLEGARIRRANRNRKAQDKFDAARKALDELDLVLARGILRKIDAAVLGEPELARYDELLLAIEARAMELDEIQARLPEEPPDKVEKRRRGFWSR